MQLASTSTPRSAANSAKCSYDSGYLNYKRTHKMINPPGCCRPLKGSFEVIGVDFYLPAGFRKVRNGTVSDSFLRLNREQVLYLKY
jgi:hypothetical protein